MTMTTLTVYDPPMCCSTGICGPDIDPNLAQFAGDLDWLKSQGVEVRRFNLAQEPASFVANAEVKAILDRSGGDELPAILVGGALVAHGRYPGRDELRSLVGLQAASFPVVITEQIRELIALGAATAAGCEPCFKVHHDLAQKLGLSHELLREAVRIGQAVKAASAKNILDLADRMLAGDEPKAASKPCCGGSAKADTSDAKGCC
jgi:AhpD family alkylhydroperoxidase